MALNQMSAVMNRRLKPNYVSAINAQTPYLPQLYQQREDTAYQNKVYDQNERGLAQANSIALRNEALQSEALDQQKKQNKTARNLGYANMALGGASGLASLYQSSKPLLETTPDLASVTQSLTPEVSNMGDLWDFGGSSAVTDTAANNSSFWDFGGTSDFNAADLVPDVVKNIGGAIWDAGSSFLSDLGDLFS